LQRLLRNNYFLGIIPARGALIALDLTRCAQVEAASSSLPAAFQKENTILTDGVSFCDCPQVLLFALRIPQKQKRNEARLATGIPRMAEPFAGALPDLLI
jgi:hypothetical protein